MEAQMDTQSKLVTTKQCKTFGPVACEHPHYHHSTTITVEVRYDDRHGNGHNTFSIIATLSDGGGGRMDEDVARLFPQLAPLIKYHQVSTDGPMHYVANTLYWLGYHPEWCRGEPGDPPNLTHARTGAVWSDMPESFLAPSLKVADHDATMDATSDEDFIPTTPLAIEAAKQRFAAARQAVIDALMARLPSLLTEFRAAVESLGFTW
jgi:hypothetical protein